MVGQAFIWSILIWSYQPPRNAWKFCNVKTMSEDRLDSHLKIWWLSEADPQTADERPFAKEFHPNQDLQKIQAHIQEQ